MSGPVLAIVALPGAAASAAPRRGGFAAVEALSVPDAGGWIATMRAAVEKAAKTGADWVAPVAPGETLAEDALELAAPGLGLYDAIFGAGRVEGASEAVARPTRLAFDAPERLPHALLNWWMPATHMVRVEAARAALERVAGRAPRNPALDYLYDLFGHARCQKSAQPLLTLTRDPQPLADEDRAEVLARLRTSPVFIPVPHGDAVYFLPYTGRNAGIEREQTRGLFFEADELEILRGLVAPGAHVVDVGANTGNHTVFFAGPMRAASVTPIEPLPEAAEALVAAVARNRLANVDLSRLGKAVGETPGRARVVTSGRGGLGATSLVPDADGDVVVARLDEMLSGPVDFLKIDVEGMEMQVLAGAEALIGRARPAIFIEIANRNTVAFSDWLLRANYRVARIFTDKGHANYLIAPGEAA